MKKRASQAQRRRKRLSIFAGFGGLLGIKVPTSIKHPNSSRRNKRVQWLRDIEALIAKRGQ